MHSREVLEPKKRNELTTDEGRNALRYLMFLNQKNSGQIKGEGCAAGGLQRKDMSKEDTSSPTSSVESLMLSCTIDAKEQQDVATADIPGAFM